MRSAHINQAVLHGTGVFVIMRYVAHMRQRPYASLHCLHMSQKQVVIFGPLIVSAYGIE